MSLDILDIIELWREWVVDVDDDDFPIRFFFVEQCHNAKNLDLFNLTSVAYKLADLADIKWVIVTFGLGLWMN